MIEALKTLWSVRRYTDLYIEPNDFEYALFSQQGGLRKVHQLFGDKLGMLIEELNKTLTA